MHTLIVGRTLYGKSAMAKQIGSDLRDRGYFVAAYNPTLEKGYTKLDDFGCAAADKEFANPDAFGDYVADDLRFKKGRKFVIVDEAHEFFTRAQCRHLWIAQRGRHDGISIIGCSQRGAAIHPTFRAQCARLYLFGCSLTDAKFLADEFGAKELLDAPRMKPGEYFLCTPDGIDRRTLFKYTPKKKTVEALG